MTTPAPVPVLKVTADRAEYKPGDEVAVTLEMTVPTPVRVAASGTLPDGTVVAGETHVTVHVPVRDEVQFGMSDSMGGAWAVQSSAAGHAVVTSVIPAA
jgi:hypothetical protein